MVSQKSRIVSKEVSVCGSQTVCVSGKSVAFVSDDPHSFPLTIFTNYNI